MSCNPSSTFSDGFNIGEIVWAKRSHDGIYWPGRITYISNNSIDTSSTNNKNHLQYQSWSYFIQFFGYTETNWTMDVLPYRQYRDYMSQNLRVHFDSYPQIKYQFLNAINQADHAVINKNPNSIKTDNSTSFHSFKTNPNDNYIPTSDSIVTACQNSTSHTTNEYPLNHCSQYASNCPCDTQSSLNNHCSYYTQPWFPPTNQLSIETNSNQLSQLTNDYHQLHNDVTSPQTETSQKIDSVMIITTKTYSNSSFISYLSNSLSNFFHSSVIYIDHLTNYQHPTTSNIYYLIFFDHFDTTIKQTLDSTILNNLNAHINYLFLLINVPCHDLITHFYSRMTDKRSILVLHYHSTCDNDPILLCSGNRTTYEAIRSSFLKYLCSKIKYIESNDNEGEQLHSTKDISLTSESNTIKTELIIDIPNKTLEPNYYQNNTDKCLPMMKHTKKSHRQRMIDNHLDKKILKRKFKHCLSKHEITSDTSSEYYVQNILDSFNSSK